MKVQDRAPERLGPYRLLTRLGEGGMGVVYLATDGAGEPVAVKALHPQMAQEETARRRLAREVETMRRVRSPNVAEVLDADLSGEFPYIVTRYVPGLTLEDVVSASGPLSREALARLASGLAEALAAVHAAGVVHRDLKPGNVMISDGLPVVIDFGIAQIPETTRLTMTGMFMGTPGYLAPEVIEGKDSGTASDVHSLGATVAFAACGRPPFGTGSFETIFYRIMHGTPDLAALPSPLVPILEAALSRDPAHRPSAAQVATWVAAIDPATLVPRLPTVADGLAATATGPDGGPAVVLGALPGTVTDGPGRGVPPDITKPLPSSGPADFADLLPPVDYTPSGPQPGVGGAAAVHGPAGNGLGGNGLGGNGPGGNRLGGAAGAAGTGGLAAAPWPGRPWPGRSGPPGGPANGVLAGQVPEIAAGAAGSAEAAAGGQADGNRPVSSWSPLVIAVVATVAAISVMAPIIGTAIALAVLVALRAASTTMRQLTRRRSGDGRRASDPVVALALYPLALLRSLAGLLLLAPVALLGFCVVAAAAIIAIPVRPLPQAVALGAGALVLIVGLGPGSSGSRSLLASVFGSVGRTRSRLTVAYVGVLALALWVGLDAWSQSQSPAYWPFSNLHAHLVHLPTIRTMLTDVRQNLLKIARHIGL